MKEGIHLIHKPRGRSSFSMVAQVRRISGVKKVGHAGTLDPQAEGLLVVLVGKEFTKRSDEFLKCGKTYEFTLRFGETSSTGDSEGEITAISDMQPDKKAIISALERYTGEILQTPPVYSAIKIDGVRAYKLAREGKEVTMKPRKAVISSIELLDYTYPYLRLRADVSSGTYIRSLGEDIGMTLKTGAYCTEIIRTRVGDFELKNANTLD